MFIEGKYHKLLVRKDNAKLTSELTSKGASVILDYGMAVLWKVPNELYTALQSLEKEGIRVPPDYDTLSLGDQSFIPREGVPEVPADWRQVRTDAKQLWLLQFIGPDKEAWWKQLTKLGIEGSSSASSASVIWANETQLKKLEELVKPTNFVQWTGSYHPYYRLDSSLRKLVNNPENAEQIVKVYVSLHDTPQLLKSAEHIIALGTGRVMGYEYEYPYYKHVWLPVKVSNLSEIAHMADVISISQLNDDIRLHSEDQAQIVAGNVNNGFPTGPNYLQWLDANGFIAQNKLNFPIVAVVDDGVDDGTTIPQHPDLYQLGVPNASLPNNGSRIIAVDNCGGDTPPAGVKGHGDLSIGVLSGYNSTFDFPYEDTQGYQLGLGVAPYGNIINAKIIKDDGSFELSACGGDIGQIRVVYGFGARITSNSWVLRVLAQAAMRN